MLFKHILSPVRDEGENFESGGYYEDRQLLHMISTKMKKQVAVIQAKLGTLPAWTGANWTAAAGLAVLTTAILAAVLVFKHTTFFVNLDNVDQFYTWYQKLAVSWHHGYLPVWNANVFGGQSFAGELQPGVFYPLNWLWIGLFGSIHGISETALNWLVAVHFWLGAFGCYLLVKQMGARKWAALLGGVTFAFSGAVAFRAISQTVIFFGLALLPYSVYFLLRYHAETKRRWLMASGVSLGMLLLVGHIDPFYFAFVALVILEVASIRKAYTAPEKLWSVAWPAAKRLVIVGAVAAIVALPQVWVSASYLGNSYRIQASGYAGPGQKISYGEFSKSFNLDMHEFTNMIDPGSYPIRDGNNIFMGLAPLAVILLVWYLAAAKLRKTEAWRQHSFFVTSMLTLSVAAMLGYVTWFATILYELPFVYEIRQLGRYSIFFNLALAMMLAIALPVAATWQLTKRQIRNLTLLGGFLLVEAVYLFALRHHVFSTHFAVQVGLAALTILALTLLKNTTARKASLVVLILATAGANTMWYLPKIQADTETVARYSLPPKLVTVLQQNNGKYRLEIDSNALPMNLGNVYAVQTTGGYSATVYAPYFNFTRSSLNRSFINDILGVQQVADVVAPKNAAATMLYSDPAHHAYVYVRPSALPKFFTVDHEGSTSRPDYHGLRVATRHYDDRLQTFSVQVPQTGQVILSEIDYPGWTAKIDGKPAVIKTYSIGKYPLLKSLHMTAGTHTVQLSYKPFKVF